jgi:murein DD-endopeptidase MepM/ murein hydrolase activator NlpD
MKFQLTLLVLLFALSCKSQIKVKLYPEQAGEFVNIYADNEEFCPVSIRIDFNVTNFDIQGGNNQIYIVESRKGKQLLTSLTVSKQGKPSKLEFKFLSNYGNHNLELYDEHFEYFLPYAQLNTFSIVQGYNGKFSHHNEKSLDFGMPVGTEVKAVREGVVVFVEDRNSNHCPKEECKKYNNWITIYHSDGTFASYVHLKKGGVNVTVGEHVSQGQTLGYSGEVGWTQGPHLHLIVYKQKLDKIISLEAKFKLNKGEKGEILQEGKAYMRSY